MDDLSMKIGLLELYELIGDNKGISFYYEDLPGVVVTIGFSLEDEYNEHEFDGNDGSAGEADDGSTGGGHLH